MRFRWIGLGLLVGMLSPSGVWGQSNKSLAWTVDYTADAVANLRGGLKTGLVYLDNLDVTLDVDVNAWLGGSGTTLFLYGLANQGGTPTELTGDAQTMDNIEAPNGWKLYEGWLEQRLWHDQASVLVGLYDLNSEFDAIQTAGLFINSSHGIGPDFSQTGENGPSIFPVTSLTARVRVQHGKFYALGAVLDAVPGDPQDETGTHIILNRGEGALWVAEVGVGWGDLGTASRTGEPAYTARFSAGTWGYTVATENLGNPNEVVRNVGWYAFAEGQLYQDPTDPSQGLAAYARIGMARDAVNRFGRYTGAGLVYTGLLTGRPADQVGLALAVAHNSTAYRALAPHATSAEINVEWAYWAALTDWASLQFDLQYIHAPDTNPNLKSVWVTALRFVLSL